MSSSCSPLTLRLYLFLCISKAMFLKEMNISKTIATLKIPQQRMANPTKVKRVVPQASALNSPMEIQIQAMLVVLEAIPLWSPFLRLCTRMPFWSFELFASFRWRDFMMMTMPVVVVMLLPFRTSESSNTNILTFFFFTRTLCFFLINIKFFFFYFFSLFFPYLPSSLPSSLPTSPTFFIFSYQLLGFYLWN